MDTSNFWWQGEAGPGPGPGPGPDYPIGQSLRFRGGNNGVNPFLENTNIDCPATFTYSAWAKLGFNFSAAESAFIFFSQSNSSGNSNPGPVFRSWCRTATHSQTGRLEWWTDTGSGVTYFEPQRFRDPSAWYHVVLRSDGTNATLFVNGEQIGVGTNIVSSVTGNFRIGKAWGDNDSSWGTNFGAYLADVYFIDGQALEPTAFGRFNENGVWVPREVDFAPAQMQYSDLWTVSSTGLVWPWISTITAMFDGDLEYVANIDRNGSSHFYANRWH